MGDHNRVVYEFSGFRLDPAARSLLRRGTPVALTPKAFDTLVFLVQNPGRLLEKDELMQALWSGDFVEESNLSHNIFILRKALGHSRNGNSFIQTIPRRGYQFVAQVTEIAAAEAEYSSLTEYWRTHSPFRSLQVFAPEDAWLFFGRDQEVHELLARLRRSPILVMVGNSGCGKSSLLRAGLIAALRAGRVSNGGPQDASSEAWRIALFRPSAAVFDYLAETLPGQLAPELGVTEQAAFTAGWRNKLLSGGDTLRNAISALVNAVPGKREPAPILLVVDQFEEIFTLTGRPEVRDRYINALLAVAHRDRAMPVHLVLALRADFYGHCLEHAGLSRCLEKNLYNVPRMTPEQLRETIEKRLQLVGGDAEAGLISALLEDAGLEPGNLALLEHTLAQLWDECASSGGTLTNQAYEKIGRLRGALGRHADSIYRELDDEKQKEQARKIFLELVHVGEGAQDTRRRLRKESLLGLGAPEEIERLLGELASSRLISISREGEETFVEVSHEALIREWPALREWLAQNREELGLRRRLQQAAEDWAALGRDPGSLLRGARLAEGEEWLARSTDAPPLWRDFLQAGISARNEAEQRELAAQQREAARQRAVAGRLRWFSCCLAVLLLIVAGAAWHTYRLQLREKSRALAAQAEEMNRRDQGQALSLAIHGWQYARTDEARLAVTKAFPQLIASLNHESGVEVAKFSPDGRRILTASDDHTAGLWSSSDGQLLASMRGHTDKVVNAEFSPDGHRIVTVSLDHTARVWDAADGTLLAVLRGHADKLVDARFSPDGRRIVTASFDGTARVWNAADGRLLAILQGHGRVVISATFSPDGRRIVTAGWDKTARVWNGADYALLSTLTGHGNTLSSAEFSPDGRRVITTSTDQTARLWNTADWHLVAILPHGGSVWHAAFSPDGRRVATASSDNTARIWDSTDGRLLATFQGHAGIVFHVTFSPDGRLLLTDGFDDTARVWDSEAGRLLLTLPSPTEGGFSDLSALPWFSAFSPDGQLVAAALGDNTARIWNIAASGEVQATLRGHTSELLTVRVSPDGERIVTAAFDHTARIWSSADGRLMATLRHDGSVWSAQFSPDGQRIVTASVDHTARIWNGADGRLLATLQGHTDQVIDAAFSRDGRRIVTVSSDQTARVWESTRGHLLATLRSHTGDVRSAQFSPDGQRIVTASFDHTARIWSSADGRLMATLRGHDDRVTRACFSPDGQRIVTASADHTARIWNGVDGRLVATLQGHTDQVLSAVFSPDGQHIVTGSADRTARLWDSANGRLLATLGGHIGEVRAARFSPDGQRIVTASVDRSARVWDSANGRLLAKLQGHNAALNDAAFFPDGQRIATGSWDQTARVWRLLTLKQTKEVLEKK